MKPIEFTVTSVPVAQPRQRHRVAMVNGKAMAMNYTPTKSPVTDFKMLVRFVAGNYYTGPPLEGPLHVYLAFVMPRPKSRTKKRGPNPREWHITKPDAENLAKSVLDALTGTLWRDDRQVCDLMLQKFVASADEQPHVDVRVSPIPSTPEVSQ